MNSIFIAREDSRDEREIVVTGKERCLNISSTVKIAEPFQYNVIEPRIITEHEAYRQMESVGWAVNERFYWVVQSQQVRIRVVLDTLHSQRERNIENNVLQFQNDLKTWMNYEKESLCLDLQKLIYVRKI